MIHTIRLITVCVGMIVMLGSLSLASAASLEGLKGNFKKRFSTVVALKKDGKIGETKAGALEAVKPEYMKDNRVRSIVNTENADRRKLYALLAKQKKTTPQVVAQRNARRNFSKAAKGEYLKQGDGNWKRK
jgi:uncharacterized protein YdbL (DUF1318 family)